MPKAWQFLISPLKSHWQALRAAREKAALAGDQISESSILVRVRGIEPRSRVWKTRILTAVLHPRHNYYNRGGMESLTFVEDFYLGAEGAQALGEVFVAAVD